MRKQLRGFEKYEQHSQDEEICNTSEDTYPDKEIILSKECTSCGKGKVVQTLEIMGKVYGTCNICVKNDRIK